MEANYGAKTTQDEFEMSTTFFRPTSPTNQNRLIVKIFNFCVFHPIWMKFFYGDQWWPKNNVEWVCLHRISSIVLIYASIKRGWHKCTKNFIWIIKGVLLCCILLIWLNHKEPFWMQQNMISFYRFSCESTTEQNMNMKQNVIFQPFA